jgi:hypothetical protein
MSRHRDVPWQLAPGFCVPGDAKTTEYASPPVGKSLQTFVCGWMAPQTDLYDDWIGRTKFTGSLLSTTRTPYRRTRSVSGLRTGGAENGYVVDAIVIRRAKRSSLARRSVILSITGCPDVKLCPASCRRRYTATQLMRATLAGYPILWGLSSVMQPLKDALTEKATLKSKQKSNWVVRPLLHIDINAAEREWRHKHGQPQASSAH